MKFQLSNVIYLTFHTIEGESLTELISQNKEHRLRVVGEITLNKNEGYVVNI